MPDLKVLTSLAGKWYPAIYLLRGFLGFVRKLKEDWARVNFLFLGEASFDWKMVAVFCMPNLGQRVGRDYVGLEGWVQKGPRTGVLKTGA